MTIQSANHPGSSIRMRNAAEIPAMERIYIDQYIDGKVERNSPTAAAVTAAGTAAGRLVRPSLLLVSCLVTGPDLGCLQ